MSRLERRGDVAQGGTGLVQLRGTADEAVDHAGVAFARHALRRFEPGDPHILDIPDEAFVQPVDGISLRPLFSGPLSERHNYRLLIIEKK